MHKVFNDAGYVEACKETALQQHANAVVPPCPYFGLCGGCNYQSLEYAAQLHAKEAQLAEALQHVGGIDLTECNVLPIVPCHNQYCYRNKTQFTFTTRDTLPSSAPQPSHAYSPSSITPAKPPVHNTSLIQHGRSTIAAQPSTAATTLSQQEQPRPQQADQAVTCLQLGLYAMDDPSQIIPINACHLQDSDANHLLQAVTQACANAPQLAAHHVSQPQGFLKQLIIRCNSVSDYLVVIVTTSHRPSLLQPLVEALQTTNVAVRGIVNKVVSPQAALTASTRLGNNRAHRSRSSKGRGAHSKHVKQSLNSQATEAIGDANSQGMTSSSSRNSQSAEAIGDVKSQGMTSSSRSNSRTSSRGNTRGGSSEPSSYVLYGAAAITERLCGLDFSISADSFFQVNSRQAEVLYSMVQQAAGTMLLCGMYTTQNTCSAWCHLF